MSVPRLYSVKVELVRKPWPIGQRWRIRIVGLNNETVAVGETLSSKAVAESAADLIVNGLGTVYIGDR